jgi:hypothetical protein
LDSISVAYCCSGIASHMTCIEFRRKKKFLKFSKALYFKKKILLFQKNRAMAKNLVIVESPENDREILVIFKWSQVTYCRLAQRNRVDGVFNPNMKYLLIKRR